MSARFHFTTCRAGSEATLKRDVARRHGGKLTPAFMKPQFITWKEVGGAAPTSARLSLFARVSGVSLGLCKTVAEVVEHVRKISARRLCLHVFPRVTPEDGVTADEWRRMDAIAAELHQAGIDFEKVPSPGGTVVDVVVGETDAEPLFLGVHEHRAGCHLQPGGLPRLTVSDEVPSRAWLKLEQALAWRGWNAADWRGQTALDLGCAPGGATYALLSRGMNVIGVDTGEMDERVYKVADAKAAAFEHWRIPAGKIDLGSLPSRIDLLVCDINLAPHQVLPLVERVQRHSPATRLILTLKLNTPELEDRAEEFLKVVRRFAPGPVHATQLAGNRREICVTACAE
ncbi:MAG: SAM-dependent methyltransferase [Prosthecobacter sp.]